ncbi:MAG: isoleucine--tRNA ligase [Candidatus Tyloplasma litorale]|nr:MAG: isoleucine--tRNA ligase [Mycoplasmatales bacterium]
MDYKDTLNMPKTKYEMRGNLKEKDPLFIKAWKDKKIYKKLSNREGEEFILHDGPPYANGDIHAGHAFNKILKDFIIRYQSLEGKKINWFPGWDTHGLPIELKIQQLGINLSKVDKEKYLEECKNYALSQVEKQQKQFDKLALLLDWNEKYLTLNPKFESNQIKVFNEMLNKKIVYQDLKPVYWSWSSETALAEAEIEYKVSIDDSIYVTFKHENSDVYVVIWTTTPWTLPGNVALSFGKEIQYSLIKVENKILLIAKDLINKFTEKTGLKSKFIKDIKIDKFIGDFCINPINNKKSQIVWGHHVTTEGGTGIVHTAGGHGHDDYLIVKENNLELFVVMDDKGHMINSGKYDELFYLKANKIIIEDLVKNNSLIFNEKIEHSVPIDWRTKKPVIYRATKQWFVSINKIKDGLIKEIENVNWFPTWGKDRLIGMTNNRSDWCISRQRLWGVPIPIIYDANSKPIIDKELQKNIEELISKKGIIAWHKIDIEKILPPHIPYDNKMKKEVDIFDVWFDSGSSHMMLEGKIADVYLEGTDQYRGWFNSSLITSYIMKEKSPYKNVITHGFVNDAKGNKMSKSVGNTIDPIKVVEKLGVDIFRLWVANTDYQDNVKISDDILKQVSKDYRKIRNSIKFILGNLYDYEEKDNIELSILSKSILNDIKNSNDKIINKYNEFNFIYVMKEIMHQLTSGSISYLLDYYKEIGYIVDKKDIRRIELQYTLKEILKFILYNIAPIIPVTAEEAWGFINNKNSIFESKKEEFIKYNDIPLFSEFLKIRDVVNKEIEKLREENKVNRTNQVFVKLNLPDKLIHWKEILNKKHFMIAKLEISKGDLSCLVEKFDGIKCERCWNYFSKQNIKNNICIEECSKIINK